MLKISFEWDRIRQTFVDRGTTGLTIVVVVVVIVVVVIVVVVEILVLINSFHGFLLCVLAIYDIRVASFRVLCGK